MGPIQQKIALEAAGHLYSAALVGPVKVVSSDFRLSTAARSLFTPAQIPRKRILDASLLTTGALRAGFDFAAIHSLSARGQKHSLAPKQVANLPPQKAKSVAGRLYRNNFNPYPIRPVR